MRFWLGFLVGALVGAGGAWVALEQPWVDTAELVVAPDTQPAADEPDKDKRRRGRRGGRRTRRVATDEMIELTAAQRKVVWRGPAVALPTRQVDFEGGDTRPLRPAEINQVIRARSGTVLDCIGKARGNAVINATVQLKMLVNGSGRVDKVRVRAPVYLFENGFLGCATSAAKGMSFPATGAHTVVDAPFDLF